MGASSDIDATAGRRTAGGGRSHGGAGTIPLPSSIGDVTEQWLGAVLAASGTLAAGDRVAAVEHQPCGAGIGLTSDLFRVLYRSSGGGEGSVIVKLSAHNELRSTVDAVGLYQREVAFYRDVAQRVPLRSPRLHVALQAEESSDFVLVLEDLRGLAAADQLRGLEPSAAEAAVDAAARFHAWGWERTDRLAELDDRFPSVRNELTRTMYPGFFEAGWASYRSCAGCEPRPALCEVAGTWRDALPFLLDELAEPATLCHGDYRADNLFFGDDGAPTVIDFQLVQQGCGASDVAYLVSQSVDRCTLELHQRLVRRYCDALAAEGITYPFDQAWRQYRAGIMFNLVTAVVTTMSWPSLDERGRDLVLRLVERAGEAIEVTDALSLLP